MFVSCNLMKVIIRGVFHVMKPQSSSSPECPARGNDYFTSNAVAPVSRQNQYTVINCSYYVIQIVCVFSCVILFSVLPNCMGQVSSPE